MNRAVAVRPTLAATRERMTFADWADLLKLRIALFVVYAAMVGALLAGGADADLARVFEAGLWIASLTAAASIFNQLLERDTDALMERTAQRPLLTGRLRARDAVLLAAALTIAGTACLAVRFNLLTALLGLATLVSYVLIYTPLKRYSSFNTLVGAIPGAMPPVLGYAAIAGDVAPWGWMLFAIIFVWQFPHFMAIAWIHRADYRRAGLKMLPALDGGEPLAGRQALLYALVILPVSLWPVLRGDAGIVYGSAALLLGVAYIVASALFALRPDRKRAYGVLFTSLVYLPIVFTFVLLDPQTFLVLVSQTQP